MQKTRQPIPAGLAEIPPGPGLAAVLDSIDPTRLSGLDCVELLRARHRQASHEQVRFMAAMVEVGLCGMGPDDALPRMDAPDEWSADEIRGALCWTRSAADTQLSLAWDLMSRLPGVFAALDAGSIDVPKAKVFSEWTTGLTDDQARQICDQLLPEAPGLTTGQLCERIKRLAIAIDPDWARHRYEDAVRERKVVAYRNADGTGDLCGRNLEADRVAASSAHIDALARKVKQTGDRRPIDLIRADLFVGMTDGTFTGYTEAGIIAHLLALTRSAAPDAKTTESHPNPHAADRGKGTDRSDRDAGLGDPQSRDRRDGGDDELHQRRGRRAGVEIRAEITTLLGLDDHPAEIAGWGYVHADLARTLVSDQTAAEWRFAITDGRGRLLHEGITRVRPVRFADPRARARSWRHRRAAD
jgi:hypothetical protein